MADIIAVDRSPLDDITALENVSVVIKEGRQMKMSKPVCAIIGIGPGNGASFARKFNGRRLRDRAPVTFDRFLERISAGVQ